MSTRTATGEALCGTCDQRRRAAASTAELHTRAVASLKGWLPALNREQLMLAVTRAAATFREAGWLVDALVDVAVLHASTTAPPVIDRLVAELVDAGAIGIAPPRCVRCGRSSWLTQRLDGHRACMSCAQRLRVDTCGRCGRQRDVSTRDPDGIAVCGACSNKDRARWEPCARCGTLTRPARRLPDGTVWCRSCNRPTATCGGCGVERPCDGVRSGNFRCAACSRREAPCSCCGRAAKVAVVWATGPVCSTCHHKGLQAKTVCDGCGNTRRPDPRDRSGRCSDCVGLPPMSVCQGCAIEDRIYRRGRCWRCTLADVFDSHTGSAGVDLAPSRALLLATDRPRSVVRWLETKFASDTVTRLGTGELAMTHQAIDALGDNIAVSRLRAELVTAGLLLARDETVVRLERWIAAQLDAVTDHGDRRVVDAFATWWVLRRFRNRADRTETANSSSARKQIARAAEFLAFVRGHGRTLATSTQADVDLWLTGPPCRRDARNFLRWAHRRRLCGELIIGHRVQEWPTRQLTPGAHQQIIRRLLTDATISLVDRASGLLVGCYGQTPARLVRLTIDDINIDANAVTVRFGNDRVILAEPVAACVAALIVARRGRAATDSQAASRWLFPGGFAGRHLDPETLANRLRQLGISAIKLRTDVLLDLAADIPPAILADLIGLSPSTAARWTHAAGGDWAHYVASRTREPAPT